MTRYNPDFLHHQSIRLREYDYSQEGILVFANRVGVRFIAPKIMSAEKGVINYAPTLGKNPERG